ncbi:hypothetical protein D049_1566B, partial [Vibrio parahaemolyticus VPTS-2010]
RSYKKCSEHGKMVRECTNSVCCFSRFGQK